ncbi:hypothetical protein [Yersinia ruckeri]|uniref:hypothetical protein n=1 Tax=Yersinia ruckeri TaxID=29486 RepID=UPI00223747AB|nr:hypothetical protein [Yersinia ruckeri]MCW6615612.1 hypothetical protein [Yersinia ruckeri]
MKELDSFTVDQLNDFIKSDHAQCGDVAALAAIALAAKRAEPVYQYQSGICNDQFDGFDWVWDDCDKGFYEQYAADRRRIVYTTPQLNFPEKPEGWKIGKFGYQDLFNAIGAAVSSPHAGGFSISVKAFEEAMLAAAPLQLSELLTAAKPEGLQRHIFSALVNELRDVPAIGCKRALIISALNRHGVVADPIRPGSKP